MSTINITSSYDDTHRWQDDIIAHFPQGVWCPICLKGTFQPKFINARVVGECDHCRTHVMHYFYDARYTYLDDLAARQKENMPSTQTAEERPTTD